MIATLIISLLVLLVIVVGVAGFVIGIYNRLITLRNRYKNAFAQIDVQLKRRYDLIPNLVETAKGYMAHERATLEAVIAARNMASSAGSQASSNPGDPQSMRNLNQAEVGLTGALGKFFAVAEAYPDLKANQNMLQVQEELASTENKVAFARQAFNDAVLGFNNAREVFPNNIVAGTFNFSPAEPFEVDAPEQREAPKVSF